LRDTDAIMGAIDIFMSDDYFGLGDGLHG